MPEYMYGNLAVRKKHQQEIRYIEKKKTVTTKASIPAKEKLFYLLMIALCVVISSIVVWKYAQIYEVNTNIQNAEQQLAEVKRDNEALLLEIRKLKEPGRLIEMGRAMGFETYEADTLSEVSVSGY